MNYPVPYLENHDFDSRGNLIQTSLKDKPLMIMVQASWCGACQMTKPVFEQFAKMGLLNTAYIQVDGSRPSQLSLAERVNTIAPESVEYYPTFFIITPSGQKFMFKEGQSIQDFMKAAKMYQDYR
jgi:thiol-disulfide isomerase/thioredoxin